MKTRKELREYWRRKKKEYRQNPEVRKKDVDLNRKYYQRADIKKKNLERMKIYRQTKRYRRWQIEYRQRRREQQAIRRRNPVNRLSANMNRCLYESLKAKGIVKRRRRWESLVGYTIKDLKEHLSQLFLSGMSWNNYGKWHIDHKIPRSKFNFTSIQSSKFKACWTLANLRPMWKIENLRKGNRSQKEAMNERL